MDGNSRKGSVSDIHHKSEFAHAYQESKDSKFKQEEGYEKYMYFPEECQKLWYGQRDGKERKALRRH